MLHVFIYISILYCLDMYMCVHTISLHLLSIFKLQTWMNVRVLCVNKFVPTLWGAMNVVAMMDIQLMDISVSVSEHVHKFD